MMADEPWMHGSLVLLVLVVQALTSDKVSDMAISLVSEEGYALPNMELAPWELF